MAQPQRQADVHQDELCPPNKRYALMDASKKIDLDNPLCLNESKIMVNILQNHPLKFSIAALSSAPWIYLGQFLNTLKEDGSKYRLKNGSILSERSWFYTRIKITIQLQDGRTYYADVVLFCQQGKNKAGVRTKILSWMITDEMKLTKHYRMYAAVFRVDVPTTQSQSIESTQRTHRTTSSPRLPNPDVDEGESKVEITAKVQPANTIKEEEESAEDDYELKRREKGKNVKETRHTPSPTTIRSLKIHYTLISSDTKKLQELTVHDLPPSSSTPSSS
ncbi:hypothetical protein Tco_0950714 [Tanacetum coccineum]